MKDFTNQNELWAFLRNGGRVKHKKEKYIVGFKGKTLYNFTIDRTTSLFFGSFEEWEKDEKDEKD